MFNSERAIGHQYGGGNAAPGIELCEETVVTFLRLDVFT